MSEKDNHHEESAGTQGRAGSARNEDWTSQATNAWQDIVSGAVRTASQVINEQIQAGQRTAQEVNNRLYDMGGAAFDGRQFQDLWFGPWADLTARWLEMMGGMAGARPANSGGFGPRPTPGAGGTTRVIVNSRQPTSLEIDLSGQLHDLVADPLKSDDPNNASLTVTALDTSYDGQVTVRLDVPETQAAGTYEGAVRERATNHQVGRITVTVEADT